MCCSTCRKDPFQNPLQMPASEHIEACQPHRSLFLGGWDVETVKWVA